MLLADPSYIHFATGEKTTLGTGVPLLQTVGESPVMSGMFGTELMQGALAMEMMLGIVVCPDSIAQSRTS
jgi:hypothetical protein